LDAAIVATTLPCMTHEEMDALVEGHYRAEVAGDIGGIVDGFVRDAEHDVAGRPGERLHGREEIARYYTSLLSTLRIDRFEPVRRWYGERHVTDEAVLHGTAVGPVFGIQGHGRALALRILHVFEFDGGLINRESAWLDVAGLQRQLGASDAG
jgi:hypothetical protein